MFNLTQKRILVGGTAILITLAIFVPWQESLTTQSTHGDYGLQGVHISKSIGYRPLFLPPQGTHGWTVDVNWLRVVIPMGVVIIATSVGVLLTKSTSPFPTPGAQAGSAPHG